MDLGDNELTLTPIPGKRVGIYMVAIPTEAHLVK